MLIIKISKLVLLNIYSNLFKNKGELFYLKIKP
jgi:hypothetical protein